MSNEASSTNSSMSREARRVAMMLEKDRERFDRATKISVAEALADNRWVAFYDPTETVNAGDYDNAGYRRDLADLIDEARSLPADERPTYVYPCVLDRFEIRADSMVEGAIENACCDHHENMAEQVVGETALLAAIQPFVDAFNAKQTGGSWDRQSSLVIVLDYAEPTP